MSQFTPEVETNKPVESIQGLLPYEWVPTEGDFKPCFIGLPGQKG